MNTFFTILGQNIYSWWTFMCNTEVPQCGFSFATLFIFVACFNMFIGVFKYIVQRHLGIEPKGDDK